MKKIRQILAIMLLIVAPLTPLLVNSQALAIEDGARQEACEAIGVVNDSEDCTSQDADGSLNKIIATVVNILSWVVGIVAVIMIIIAGFKYITSGGDSNGISSAKTTLLYAVIGLLIVASAQFLVKFVLVGTTDSLKPDTSETSPDDTTPSS